ncbi:hypothetical protein ABT354_35865 [Streptomyces sp. NPDC000594]|uniref:hypothetical protein n=1 Tax=Streptomyces sp. NPDC000594 TaxID=3154261 RepID=UPI003327B519
MRITQGAVVALRTEADGTLVVEPLWAFRNRMREKYAAALLADHLPAGPAQLYGGGRGADSAGDRGAGREARAGSSAAARA